MSFIFIRLFQEAKRIVDSLDFQTMQAIYAEQRRSNRLWSANESDYRIEIPYFNGGWFNKYNLYVPQSHALEMYEFIAPHINDLHLYVGHDVRFCEIMKGDKVCVGKDRFAHRYVSKVLDGGRYQLSYDDRIWTRQQLRLYPFYTVFGHAQEYGEIGMMTLKQAIERASSEVNWWVE